MPNILANKMVVPEYVMQDATVENIYNEAVRILADPLRAKAGYAEVRALLGEKGATAKAAGKILEFIGAI
jgi:lipid-A-disaccharide synthase